MYKQTLIALLALSYASFAAADDACDWCGVEYLEPSALSPSADAHKLNWSQGESETDKIDLLIAFDQSAVNWITTSGWNSVSAFAEEAIFEMNAGLAQTGLDKLFTFRLAGICEVESDLSKKSLLTILNRVEGRNETLAAINDDYAAIRQRREAVRADIVAVLVDSTSSTRGYSTPFESKHFNKNNIAEIAKYAYCVCSIKSLATHYSLLHEVGHIMGAGHCDTQKTAQGPQLFSYSAGYRFTVGGNAYTTIMGYPSTSADNPILRLPFFSSPEYEMDGVPIGTVSKNDNTRTLRETYKLVANFRVSKTAVTPEPEPEPDPEPTGLFGPFTPAKAINAVYPYTGAVRDANGDPCGTISFKVGKPNKKTGISSVSGTITTIDGKKYTIKTAKVSVNDKDSVTVENVTVTKFGTITYQIGNEGFYALITKTDGTQFAAVTTDLTKGLSEGTSYFSLDGEIPAEINNLHVLTELLPNKTPLSVNSKGKITLTKAAMVKYAKIKGSKPAAYELVIDTSKNKTNLPGLKLTYTAKTSTIKGSFCVYTANEAKHKITKLSFTVTGMVIDGAVYGTAVCKKPALSFPITVGDE